MTKQFDYETQKKEKIKNPNCEKDIVLTNTSLYFCWSVNPSGMQFGTTFHEPLKCS